MERHDGTKLDAARPTPAPVAQPYQAPAVVWEEEFVPLAASCMNPDGCTEEPPP